MKTSKFNLPFLSKLLLWGTGGITLIVSLIILSIWQTSDRTLSFFSNLFKPQPLKPKVEAFEPIVQRIQNIQELSTTVQTIETVVPTSADRKLGEISLATTKLLYIARGEIRAGVDLSKLTEADIKVANNRIEIDLPSAKILDSKIDVNHSRVYNYDRGFLNLGPDVAPQLQTLAQRKTLTEIVNTACKEGILDDANILAKEAISQLLKLSNYEEIKINITQPKYCGVDDNLSSQISDPLLTVGIS